MTSIDEPHFGKRNRPRPERRVGIKTSPTNSKERMSDRGASQSTSLSNVTYYMCLGGLALFTIATVAYILEDPEVRAAREAKQAIEAEQRAEAERQRQIAANRPKLTYDIGKCTKSYGFAEITGEVTNQTGKPMKSLMVVGVFKDSNGSTIKTSSAMVEYQPLLAGQSSPYKVITTNNPAIRSCNVAFKTMFGGQIKAERE